MHYPLWHILFIDYGMYDKMHYNTCHNPHLNLEIDMILFI